MADLFKGFARLSDGQIADQVALLRTMTLWNSLSPALAKGHRGVIRTINWVSRVVNKPTDLSEPEVKEIPQLIQEERIKWNEVDRERLDLVLREELAKRAGVTLPASDLALSVAIIRMAAVGLKVSEDLSPAQQAHFVFEEFLKRSWEMAHKKTAKQNQIEAEAMERELDAQINSMPADEQEKLQELLKVEKLTGAAVRATLLKASTPVMIMGYVELAGFSAYILLSRLIFLIFTAFLQITVPFAVYTGASSVLAFLTGPVGWGIALAVGWWQLAKGSKTVDREMLAQAICIAVPYLPEPLIPPAEVLPSWVPADDLPRIQQLDTAFAQLLKERDEAVAAAQQSTRELEQSRAMLAQTQTKMENEKTRQQRAEASKRELEENLPILRQKEMTLTAQLTTLHSEVEDYRRRMKEIPAELAARLSKAEYDVRAATELAEEAERKLHQQIRISKDATLQITALEISIRDKDATIAQLSGENTRLLAEKAQTESQAEKEHEARRRELERLWKVRFEKMIFQPNPLRWVAHRRRFEERLEVERALVMLNNAADPMALLPRQ
jgi:hypothetical protein